MGFDFTGKTVFITGASNGLGKIIALSFAMHNTSILILTGKNQARLENVIAECTVHCQNTFGIVGDMNNNDDIERILSFVEEKSSNKLDIFIGNHGITKHQEFDQINAENGDSIQTNYMSSFDHIMNINFTSNVKLTNRLCRIMPKDSSIVFTTSIHSNFASSKSSAYCSSKAALKMFAKCAALDLGSRGIRVNTVAPGTMNTDFHHEEYDSKEKQDEQLHLLGKKLPRKHLTSLQGVANAILFLASDKAADITGSEQIVDCGQSLLMGEG